MFAVTAVAEALVNVVWPVTVSVVAVVLPVVEVPEVSVVTVALVAVRLVIVAVTALRSDAKKFEDVAFVVTSFTAKRLVDVLFVVEALVLTVVVKRPVVLLSVVIVDDGEVRSVIVAFVIVDVASVTVPVAVRAPVVTEKNVGAVATLIVEVPVIDTLAPALSDVRAVFTSVFHCEVEAVSGIVYPAVTVGVKVSVEPDPEIVSPIPVADDVAKVYDVAESPLIVVVAKYPLSTLPLHERLDPAVIRDEGVVVNDDHSVVEAVSGTE